MTVHRLQYIEGTVRGKIANREKYKQTEEWRRLNGRLEREVAKDGMEGSRNEEIEKRINGGPKFTWWDARK
jgi:hypothetical protein